MCLMDLIALIPPIIIFVWTTMFFFLLKSKISRSNPVGGGANLKDEHGKIRGEREKTWRQYSAENFNERYMWGIIWWFMERDGWTKLILMNATTLHIIREWITLVTIIILLKITLMKVKIDKNICFNPLFWKLSTINRRIIFEINL